MTKSLHASLAFLMLFGLSIQAMSAEQCPAINCDCAALPNPTWVEVCEQHENRIKKACVDNANTPRDYCLVHGLNAKPLPLAIELNEFTSSEFDYVDDFDEKISALYWAIHADTGEATEAFENKKYPRVMQILKVTEANLDNIFNMQQNVEAIMVSKNRSSRIRGAWKDYSPKTEKYAQELEVLGRKISEKIPTATTPKEKKIFTVLSKKALRMAGKGYEHAGYAQGRALRHKNAANNWKVAASISVFLAELDKSAGGKRSNAQFAEFQSAARLHRASYHWLLDNKASKATDTLRESQLFVNREEQKNLEVLVDRLENTDEAGVLTGR